MSTRADVEWLWQALRDGQYQLVRNLAPCDFDWRSLHPVFGTPLMAVVHEVVLLRGGAQREPHLHDLIRWAMKMGADPRMVAPVATALSVGFPPPPPGDGWVMYKDGSSHWWWFTGLLGQFWCNDHNKDDVLEYETYPDSDRWEVRVIAECHAGHSAISLGIAIKRKLLPLGSKAFHLVSRIDAMLAVFAEAAAQQCRPTVLVDEGAVDMWGAVLEDSECADVELQLEGEGRVQAHSLVLCKCSSVLKAILGSSMREGRTRVITVTGASAAALRQFLALVYTGCFEGDDELPARVQLEALDLAHRWQVERAVDALETSLARLAGRGFPGVVPQERVKLVDELLEAAVLKQLRRLRVACHQLVGRDAHLKHALHRGSFGRTAVRELQQALLGSAAEPDRCPAAKRRRPTAWP